MTRKMVKEFYTYQMDRDLKAILLQIVLMDLVFFIVEMGIKFMVFGNLI
jgi:hypothetical protein